VATTAIRTVQALASADTPSIVYVAAADGLYRSTAPFVLWERRTALGTISALSVNPQHADHLVYATADGHLFRSTDGGRSARPIGYVLPGARLVRAPSRPSTLYLAENSDSAGMLERSLDDGQTWQWLLAPQKEERCSPCAFDDLAVDGARSTHLLAAVSMAHGGAVIESRDGGRTWRTLVAAPDATPDVLTLNPVHAADIWVSWRTASGQTTLQHSWTAGRSWLPWDGELDPTATIKAITFVPGRECVYVDIGAAAAGDAPASSSPNTVNVSCDGVHFASAPSADEHVGACLLIPRDAHYLISGDASTPLRVVRL
jgi:photosystem II stability/assembly factor-like uncharacterized protein